MNEEGVRYQGRARKRGRHGTQKSNMDDLLRKMRENQKWTFIINAKNIALLLRLLLQRGKKQQQKWLLLFAVKVL